MKKILFSLSLVLLFSLTARANAVSIQNFLPNPISVYFTGVNPDGTTFTTGYVTLMPGAPASVFANPTLIPGVTGAWTTGRVVACFGFCNPYDLALGSPNIGQVQSTQYIPNGNACNSGDDFDMYWNEANLTPYDAFIIII